MNISEFQVEKIKDFLSLLGFEFSIDKDQSMKIFRFDDLLTSVKRYQEGSISFEDAAKEIKKYRSWINSSDLLWAKKFNVNLFGNLERSITIAASKEIEGENTPKELYMIVEEGTKRWFVSLTSSKAYAPKGNPIVVLDNKDDNGPLSVGLSKDCFYGDLTSMLFLDGSVVLESTFDRIQERNYMGKTVPYLFGDDSLSLDNYINAIRNRLDRWNSEERFHLSPEDLDIVTRFCELEAEKLFKDMKNRPDFYIEKFSSYGTKMEKQYGEHLGLIEAQKDKVLAQREASRQEVENGIQLLKKLRVEDN